MWLQDSHGAGRARALCTEDDDEDDDDDHEDMDQGHKELGLSQLDDAPWTQPTQQVGTRRRRPPDPYTPGTHALGHKGKGMSRRQ
jgi:hypothetical protein